MRTIDIHAHLMPQCLWKTVDAGQSWHGSRYEPGAGLGTVVRDGKRIPIKAPNYASHRKSASGMTTGVMCK